MYLQTKNLRKLLISFLLISLISGLFVIDSKAQGTITTPEDFFGFKLGTDKKLARWDKLIEYFYLLEKESDRLKVVDMGPSTMGNPFLVLIISSPENLSNLDRLQELNKKISDPRGISEAKINEYIQEGKAVICQSMSLHASEVGGTQSTPDLAYDLVARNDVEVQRILDNVLFFMIPSFNPDGQIMITDWYRKTAGTQYDGLSLPWLYNKYVGHDNNRDGDFLTLPESKYAAKLMYVDWPPQAYIDHHHMGSYGARFYVPPYCDPIRPYADPLIWREISWYGSHIAYKLEEAGIKGVLNAAQYPGWGHFGWHWITPFHNIAGMLTESAGVAIASPIYIHPEQLKGGSRQFPEYEAQSTFPSPWPGGWWRLENIVEQKKISALALLDMAAKNRETVLHNAYLKARHQTERGAEGKINAVVIPTTQHDPLTAVKMINILLKSGIEIKKAVTDFTIDSKVYDKGSYLISFAQPKMGLIRNLLVQTVYADNEWTRDKNGAPLRPYDLSTHTMFEFMGVNVDPVNYINQGNFRILAGDESGLGKVDPRGNTYIFDGRLNDSFIAVNLLQNKQIEVKRLTGSYEGHNPGDFIVRTDDKTVLEKIAQKLGVSFSQLNKLPADGIVTLEKKRLGMYRRYYGGNMDEGWTRLLLDRFEFPYNTLRDAVIKKGNLNKNYDVIILPDDSPGMITGEIPEGRRGRTASDYPEEYQSGIGKDGVKNIVEFVDKGGTLVLFGGACEFAIKEFKLQIQNVAQGQPSSEFFCSGSTLRAVFENNHPLAYGMPEEGLVVFVSSPAFEIRPGRHNDRYKTIVRYKDKNLLESGWLIGEKVLTKKAAMINAEYGDGNLVLIGFRTQHRFQTHGTFKLLFNALIQ